MDLRKRTKRAVTNTGLRRSKRLKESNPTTSQIESENEYHHSEMSNGITQQNSGESCSEVSDSDSDAELLKTKYMKERGEINLKRRHILEELDIIKLNKDIQDIANREKAQKVKKNSRQFQRTTTERNKVGIRKSLRALKKEPISTELIAHEEPTHSIDKYYVTNKEFPLTAVGFEKLDTEMVNNGKHEELKAAYADYDAFINLLKTTPVVKTGKTRCKGDMQAMTIVPENVQKVTTKRVYSMAIHPSSSDLLVAAGDTVGNLGLWKPLLNDSNNGTYMFHVVGSTISTLKFSSVNSNKLYMSSYSGQLRSMDLERAVVEEAILHAETVPSFDFIGSGHSIIAAHRNGEMTIYDTRESKESGIKTYQGPGSATRCISCHPVEHQYFLTSHMDGSIRFFDMRKITGKKNGRLGEIFCVHGPGRTVNAAYFSPISGNSVLTTCLDDKLRIFDSRIISRDQVKLRASCHHCNQTGRWLTPFKATWHPESDDIFVIGSMSRPRQIELYNAYAKTTHTLKSPDVLTTVTSVNCLFKNEYLFGGNSSGKVYMFSS